MIFTIWIVSPPNYQHSRCFEEVALGLRDGLRELGHEADITKLPGGVSDNGIVLGAHLLHPDDLQIFRHPVIWQLEQIPDFSEGWRVESGVNKVYMESLRRAEVWDYSKRNIDELAKSGVAAKLLPVGYAESLSRIPGGEQSIDVLFYGSINHRRAKVLEELERRGVNVHRAFGVYGEERDFLIARSKIVLNIHYYEAKVFEIVRCSYLLANRKCVVSEAGKFDNPVNQEEKDFTDGIYFSAYDGLADSCLRLLADNEQRQEIEQRGFEIFSKMRQADYLEKLVGRMG